MKKWGHYLLFGLLFMAFFLTMQYLPVLQKQVPKLQGKRLQGSYEETKRPNFWPRRWMDGSYQKGFESYLKDRNVIAPFFVRMKTEVDYHLFHDIPHENILAGKNGHFFPKTDCEAYVGGNFVGEKDLKGKVDKLKFLIEHYQQKGIQFLIMLPPGKPAIYPEYLPDYYQEHPKDSTNRNVIRKLLHDRKIPFLDFDFLKNHKEDGYALFAQASLHWSHYGFGLAADHMRDYIVDELKLPMPLIQWKDSIEVRDQFAGMDTELVNGSNFLSPPPLDPVPYPIFRYQMEDSLAQKTKILSVSDSYYLALWDHGLHSNLFAEGSLFFYYNHEVHPPRHQNGKRMYAHEFDHLATIEEAQLIVITVYETNLNRFGFKFIEGVYEKIKEKESQN